MRGREWTRSCAIIAAGLASDGVPSTPGNPDAGAEALAMTAADLTDAIYTERMNRNAEETHDHPED